MQLALFTPGAYLWPVLRNFEVFISSLSVRGVYSASLRSSPLYPLQGQTEPAPLSRETDGRLRELHRELYAALLSPAETFADDSRCFAERFYPDLEGTSVDALIEALFYYFTCRTRESTSISEGLSALRAIFFNHESAEPDLWLHGTLARLTGLRAGFPLVRLSLPAPAGHRIQDLAFVACESRHRSPQSTGWVWGELKRWPDGIVRAQVECGLDPSLEDITALSRARSEIETELSGLIGRIFGWQQREAA